MGETKQINIIDHARQDEGLIRTLSNAFQNDPSLSWILPDAEEREKRLPRLFATMLKADRNAGMVLASPQSEAATLWRAPGQTKPGIGEQLLELWPMVRTFGSSLTRGITLSTAMTAHHPCPDDYWYLQYAAVAPDAQGKGWGGVAIRAGVAHATAAGKPVLLETAKKLNVGIYLRLGFEVIHEWDVPGGGPHFWTMLRPLDA